MAQDVWQNGIAESAPVPQQDGEKQRSRRNALALLVTLSMLAALIVGVVLLVAPWASAAGGCGGG